MRYLLLAVILICVRAISREYAKMTEERPLMIREYAEAMSKLRSGICGEKRPLYSVIAALPEGEAKAYFISKMQKKKTERVSVPAEVIAETDAFFSAICEYTEAAALDEELSRRRDAVFEIYGKEKALSEKKNGAVKCAGTAAAFIFVIILI